MRALITGGAGFIGSHLAEKLIAAGHHVTVIDDLSTGRKENLAMLDGRKEFQFVIGTVLDEALMDTLVKRCDSIFHLAAAVGVELIIKQPLESLTTNIKGSEIMLQMAHRYHKKILIASTSEIYGKNTKSLLKEDDDRVLGPPSKTRWSYSTAKAVDEILAYVYWKDKQVTTVVARLFNTVGPRQTGYYGMVLPRFIEQALHGKPITVYGTGKQTRCFTHVSDVVGALIKLSNEPKASGEVFNIGSQQEISIKQLAKEVIRLTKSRSKIKLVAYQDAYEAGFEDTQRRVPDTGKLKKLIGFEPTYTLEKIITDIIRHRAHSAPADMESCATS